ncbi:hypothetical protein CB0940_02058 [Cercospora beticola]|uniref:Uncharacterized protein n=1 Tax=Cercospora beticola TaxID=122368 RepID=A0A2G5I9Q7_CERBT|nr:hypothetical protein CB0940_02058 [Cercospora beticola]PIB01525.1 hypothetical protein CB0940_02058 [Cercospora beticola]WPA97529.1 hypothetical protein RHO25_002139 [Cercospora beticola]
MELFSIDHEEPTVTTSTGDDAVSDVFFPSRIPTKAIHEFLLANTAPPLLYSNPQPRDAMHNQIEPPKDVENYLSYTSGNLAYIFHATLDEVEELRKTFNSFVSKKSFDSQVLGYSSSKGFGSSQFLSNIESTLVNDNGNIYSTEERAGNKDLQAAFQQTPKEREKLVNRIESSSPKMRHLLRGGRWSSESNAPEQTALNTMRFYAVKKLVDVYDPRGVAKTLDEKPVHVRQERAIAKLKGDKEWRAIKSKRFIYDSEDEINGHLVWTRKNRLKREEKASREKREKLQNMLREAEKRRKKIVPFSIWCACHDADKENVEGRFSDLLETENDRTLAEHWLKLRSWNDEEKELKQALSEIEKEISRCGVVLEEEQGRQVTSFPPKTTQNTTSCSPSSPTSPADSAMCMDEDTADVAMTEVCTSPTLAAKSGAEVERSKLKKWRKLSLYQFNAVVKAARLRGKPEDGKTAEKQYDELVNGPGMAGSNLDLEMCS